MGGADYASADDSMGGYEDEPKGSSFGSDHDYLNLNSSMWEYRHDDSLYINMVSAKAKQVTDIDYKDLDKWKEVWDALHTTADAGNNIFSAAALIGNADKSYKSFAIKRAVVKSSQFGDKLGTVSFVLDTYEYLKAMDQRNYRKAFSVSFNFLVGTGVGALSVPTGLSVPLGIGTSELLDRYDVGGHSYDRINTMLDEGYTPEPGVFW